MTEACVLTAALVKAEKDAAIKLFVVRASEDKTMSITQANCVIKAVKERKKKTAK
jgi:hypothetical protein